MITGRASASCYSSSHRLWGSQRLPTYVYYHAARSYPPQQEADQLSGGENKLAQAHARDCPHLPKMYPESVKRTKQDDPESVKTT